MLDFKQQAFLKLIYSFTTHNKSNSSLSKSYCSLANFHQQISFNFVQINPYRKIIFLKYLLRLVLQTKPRKLLSLRLQCQNQQSINCFIQIKDNKQMQAYETEEKEQGLFTFYRQQAQLEDKLKILKKEQIAKTKLAQSQNQLITPPAPISQKSQAKINEKHKKQKNQELKQKAKQEEAKIDNEKQHKQFQKKLLQILQKHKYDRNKRRNLRIIMKLGGNDQIALKYHLQALMHQQNELNLEQQKKKNDVFSQRKETICPFEKVALCPTSFQVQLDQIIETNQSKHFNSKKLGNVSNLSNINAKKLEKTQIIEKKYISADISQMLNRQLLPKIQLKASNRSVDLGRQKQQIASVRQPHINSAAGLIALDKLNKIKSMKSKYLCVESARYSQQGQKMKNNHDNKIYPIFIENKESKRIEENAKIDKEKMYVQIIRKLKFT